MSIASLPMYDLPELRTFTDAWWAGLARALAAAGIPDVPPLLDRGDDYTGVWRRPDLLLSQTCGYPLMRSLGGQARLVATPCYAAPGCEGPNYCSFAVVGRDSPFHGLESLRGARCAVNSPDSQSGYNALRALVAPLARAGRFFGSVTVSGGHGMSLERVATGEADVAAIDCVTFGLLSRYRSLAVEGVRVLCRTPSAPNLPFITRHSADDDTVARIHDGLRRAFADPNLAEARDALLLSGFAVLPLTAYDRILEIENAAIEQGYAAIA
jgi:ABC-type phosphate/phosphonate transport system substrate-binding protein